MSDEHPASVLVVDDDPDILIALEQILLMEGYRVLLARNGVEALALLEQHRPDVIVLDLMMPVMDGWEFRRRLYEHPLAGTPVIVASADRDLSQKARAMEADGFLAKPFELDALVGQVRRFAPGD